LVQNKKPTLQEITAAARARSGGREISGNLWIAFTGPAGSGKKLTAEMLAKELGVGLLRVDLDRVISKYIGETEKNLRRLFKRAEARKAILFFDEADSLFGKRSEVKDAHDRYANIGIDYLLQRLESYGGIAVLATSKKANLDQAFLRRCRFVMACR
jgi:SpoVK/Ycf46/Vps4 family AAA+-type ATPase